jgi:adenylosuccinate synthase
MSNVVILGAQWGDEGKGKIVDLFSDRFEMVVRYQGGHNAGHTVRIGDKTFVLKLIPSGISRPGKQAVIGNGLVVDPRALIAEIEYSRSRRDRSLEAARISNRAHVIFPFHRMMEKMSEGRPADFDRTTSRGIGPATKTNSPAAASASRICSIANFPAHYDALVEEKGHSSPKPSTFTRSDFAGIRAKYEAYAERLRPWFATPRASSTPRWRKASG